MRVLCVLHARSIQQPLLPANLLRSDSLRTLLDRRYLQFPSEESHPRDQSPLPFDGVDPCVSLLGRLRKELGDDNRRGLLHDHVRVAAECG